MNNTVLNSYEEQAKAFCKDFNVKVDIKFSKKVKGYFYKDTAARNVYNVLIKRRLPAGNYVQYTMTFGDSEYNTANKLKPTVYDVLACMTSYVPESFEEFLYEYGYAQSIYDLDTEDRHELEKVYKACKREANAVELLFGDISEEFYNMQSGEYTSK